MGSQAGFNGTIGGSNTFIGYRAGLYNNGSSNTLIGYQAGAGPVNGSTGSANTFIGLWAGYNTSTGGSNTFIGHTAGYHNTSGAGNVFIGYDAGANEKGSKRLYIADSNTSTPLIYGEFDNKKLTVNGDLSLVGPNGQISVSNTTADNTTKILRIKLNHYANAQLPVWLFRAASNGTNNFVALGGGASDGNAATQIDLYTAPTTTTPTGTARITIKGNGNVGIGTQNPSYPLQMASGAYVTTGGVWTNASSREYKDNIKGLKVENAMETLQGLNPVTFNYKVSPEENHVGFIAEEVPDLVAMKDRQGLSPMDIVAVLTKVVQGQQEAIQEQQKTIQELTDKVIRLEGELKRR